MNSYAFSRFPRLAALHMLCACLALGVTVHAEPVLTSWFTTYSGKYARIYSNDAARSAGNSVTTWTNGRLTQALPAYCGVQEVSYSSSWVYVSTTGLASHIMGPWQNGSFPNLPTNQKLIYRVPRTPGTVPVTKSLTGLGVIGCFVDGVAMFDGRDGFYWNGSAEAGGPGSGYWNRDAYVNEGLTFDPGLAHQQQNGTHHYHANPIALRYLLDDHVVFNAATKTYSESTAPVTKHSPIIGWVRDGYPIYGPYGYSSPMDSASAVTRMRTGYQLRSITQRTTLPQWAARAYGVTANQSGPAVSGTYPLGRYMEDKEYLGDVGKVKGVDFDLDEYNGRFCVTPEFPSGVYAYFVAIDSSGAPVYPYNIGRAFYGRPTGNAVTSITESVTMSFKGGPSSPTDGNVTNASASGGNVTLTWQSVEGGTYKLESSNDQSSWQQIATGKAAAANAVQTISTEAAAAASYYRGVRTGIAAYDGSPLVKAQITSPANGSALASTSLALQWNAGTTASGYALWVGTTPGGYNIYAGSEGTALGHTVTVPATGGRIYVTLWSLLNGAYQGSSYYFIAPGSVKADFTGATPAEGSALTGGSLPLEWTGGTGVAKYVVWVGSAPGGSDVAAFDAGTSTSHTFATPSDGGPLYATLWSLINGVYQSSARWFVTAQPASGARAAVLTSPANGSLLGSASLDLTWEAGASVTQYALWVGSVPDGYDLYAALEGVNQSRSVTLPGDGRRVYVTLFSLISGAWQANSYFFTDFTTPSGKALVTSPADGSTLAGTSLALNWSGGTGVTSYALWVGSAPLGYDLYAAYENGSTSRTVTVPSDGRPVYVTLWSLIKGAWQQSTGWYFTADTASGNKKAKMTSPANGSMLTSGSGTFAWDSGSGVSSCALWIGSMPGGYDLLAAGVTPGSSRLVSLPTDGRKIYVTLWSLINGAYQACSYFYTAQSITPVKAAMISPAQDSTLVGTSATFTWNAGISVTQYALWVGRTPGSYEIYAGLEGASTSRTVTVPADGGPIYVTLWSLMGGAWQSSESIYVTASP